VVKTGNKVDIDPTTGNPKPPSAGGKHGISLPGARYSLAATFDLLSYTNVADTLIGAGAQINQNPNYRTPDQSVDVSAKTSVDMVNLSGIFDFDLSPESVLKGRRKSDPTAVFQPLGNQASAGGIGASILVTLVNNTPTARIDPGALVHTGD